MERCPRCNELMVFPTRHTCKPSWMVWPEGEDEDGASRIFATDAKEAAEKWADDDDCNGDYTIVRGSPATVYVKDEDGETRKFEVFGEMVPHYYAELSTD